MRKSIIFSIIVFLCILGITIAIVLYANGYRYDLHTQKVETTGGIKVVSTPSNAEVYIDSQDKGKAPLSLFNISPGEHIITVKQEDFSNWSSTVVVKGGNITIVYPVLFASNIKADRKENAISVNKTFFGKDIYAYNVNDKVAGSNIYVHTFGTSFLNLGETTQFIINTNSFLIDKAYTIENIVFSPNNGRILITFTGNNLKNKYIAVATDGSGTFTDLDTQISTSLYSGIQWSNDDDHIILSNNNLIIALNITNGQKLLLSQETSMTQIAVGNKGVYYIEKNATTNQYTLKNAQFDGTNTTLIDTQSSPITSLITDEQSDYAYVTSKGLIVYATNSTVSTTLQQTTQHLIPISFSPDGKYIICEDPTSTLLSTYSIGTNELSSLHIKNADLKDLLWNSNARLIIYTSKDPLTQYFLINAINVDGSNNVTVFKGPIENSTIMISPTGQNILFEMDNLLPTNQATDKGIYQISIPGL